MNDEKRLCSAFHPDSSETVAYNNPLFPAYIQYRMLSHYPDYSSISHWHKDLEFISVKKGEMTYNVNGELIPLSEGSGIMVGSRQLHYGFSMEHKECEFICVLLSTELLQGNGWFYENYIAPIAESPAWPYQCLGKSGWQSAILERLDSLRNSFGGHPVEAMPYFQLMEDFLFIMRTLYENLSICRQAPKKEDSDLACLKKMLTYIEEHFMEPIALESLASSGACCKSKCASLFKKYLRDTPAVHITKIRLKKSLPALLGSDRNITEIAYEYGFCSASYYCETFKKYYGLSPSKYRKAASSKTAAAWTEQWGAAPYSQVTDSGI